MTYTVDPHSETPPSRQLVDAVLDSMARGELVSGQKLPSIRAMAAEALVNPNTVGKAYRELEHFGVVVGRNGSGVFVTADGESIARERRRKITLRSFERSARSAPGRHGERQAIGLDSDGSPRRDSRDRTNLGRAFPDGVGRTHGTIRRPILMAGARNKPWWKGKGSAPGDLQCICLSRPNKKCRVHPKRNGIH